MSTPSLPSPTPRLVFRELARTDALWLAAAWADPAYAALLGEPRPADPDAVWAILVERRERGDRDVLFLDRASGTPVGRGSLQRIEPSLGEAEVELEIPDPSQRRRGIGREALGALVAWAVGELHLRRLRGRIAAHNTASLALGRALGFRTTRRELPLPGRSPVVTMVFSASDDGPPR